MIGSTRAWDFLSVTGDVSIALSMLGVIWAYDKFGTPFHRGYFCDDESIKYPFQQQTISIFLLFTIAVFIPIGLMILWDVVASCCRSERGYRVGLVLRTIYETNIVFLFGVGLTFAVTDVGKYSIGRLRPHFLSVCQPETGGTTCNTGYIQDYVCHGTDLKAITQARLSFPSGHASISFFGLTYFAMFLHNRLPKTNLLLLKPVLMGTLFSVAFYVSLTRIFDYWHHPGDVLFGGLLGSGIAMLLSFLVARLGRSRKTTEDEEKLGLLQNKLAVIT